MATKVFMEALSPTMEEGRLVKWLKQEGDSVTNGDVLAEVETDKAIMELVARGAGVLRKRLIAEGATAAVGSVIGVIASADENIDALLAAAPATAAASPASAPAPAPSAAAPASATGAPPSAKSAAAAPASTHQNPAPGTVTAPTTGERPRSSPLARRLASERGISLETVQGSGPGGRIIRRDIDATASTATTSASPLATTSAAPGTEWTDVPLTQIRKTIARRLSESLGPIPTFYLTTEVDMERVAEMRSAMAELGDAWKVSFNDIVLKAVATALAQHPECNAHWLGDRIRTFQAVHIGVAVAIEDGLITPVITNAQSKGLQQIARETRDLAARARDRKLAPHEYTGSTFSVSNLGMFGIDDFTAIINPPEAGILAVGAIEAKAVVVAGAVQVRRRMRLTMSCDHRVIDGATGAKFLQTLRRLLENPLLLAY